jgi:hypothetical protein
MMARLVFTDRVRSGERPAYEQLRERTREHTRDIERLKSEF